MSREQDDRQTAIHLAHITRTRPVSLESRRRRRFPWHRIVYFLLVVGLGFGCWLVFRTGAH